MKLGYLTACLPKSNLGDHVSWAADHGFSALEVGCWPSIPGRDWSGCTIEVAALDRNGAECIKELFRRKGLVISSLAFYENNLDQSGEQRAFNHAHLKKVIDAAALLGVDLVGTFVGRDLGKSVEANLEEFGRVFPELVGYAEGHGVRLMVENCPMEGWHPEGGPGNCAYSPELWREMFRLVPNAGFGLNYDPSHLVWLGIDYLEPIREFRQRIFHVHAKDAEILLADRNRYGVYGRQLGRNQVWENGGWWRYRMPGFGAVDWRRFISTLGEQGYDGVISIEHEDPIWAGSEERILKGLELGLSYLQTMVR